MQNLKLLSFALLGAGLLGFHLTTLTGCEASAEATGGAAGSSDAGSGGSTVAGSGGSAAGMAGEAGMAGMAGEAGMAGSAGSAGGPTSTSGAAFAAALKGDEMCKACIEGLSGTAQDGGGQDVICDGIVAKCDGDQTCQDFIASAKDAGEQGADTDPNCWIEAAGVALNGGNTITNELTACAVAKCSDKCGSLSFAAPTGCD